MTDARPSAPTLTPLPGGASGSGAESAAMTLARAAARGDVPATRQLLDVVGPRLKAVARVVLGGGHPDADDVVQQALIGFVQALGSFRGECEPARFAARIAVRTAMAAKRRARAMHHRHDDLVDPDALATNAQAPGVAVLAERRRTLLRQLLGELPEEQAESLALRVMLGWTLEEVATTTGAPVNTVRSRLRLAKEALRRAIEADPILREALGVDSSEEP